LDILAAVGYLHQELQQAQGIQLAIRGRGAYGAGRCGGDGWSRTAGAVGTG
jgi:hypothetical protein